MFIHGIIKVEYELFLFLKACLCCTSKLSVGGKLMVEIKIWKTDVVFSLVFVNSKRHARDMVFWKRTITMAKNDHKSCVLTQICIAYNLILTCRWHVKFDVNVFSNIKTNVAIFNYKTDIAYTCCKQLSCTVLSSYPSSF